MGELSGMPGRNATHNANAQSPKLWRRLYGVLPARARSFAQTA